MTRSYGCVRVYTGFIVAAIVKERWAAIGGYDAICRPRACVALSGGGGRGCSVAAGCVAGSEIEECEIGGGRHDGCALRRLGGASLVDRAAGYDGRFVAGCSGGGFGQEADPSDIGHAGAYHGAFEAV